jgi:hypothetical protein
VLMNEIIRDRRPPRIGVAMEVQDTFTTGQLILDISFPRYLPILNEAESREYWLGHLGNARNDILHG